jgi:hypothetical protein
LSVEETAETLQASAGTVLREWRLTKAWLGPEAECGATPWTIGAGQKVKAEASPAREKIR